MGGQRRLGLEGHFPEGQEGERHSGAYIECDRHGRLPWSSPQRESAVHSLHSIGETCSVPTKELWSGELNAHCWLTHVKRIKPKRVIILDAAMRKGSGLEGGRQIFI